MSEKEIKLNIKLNDNHLNKATNFFSKYVLVSMLGDSDKKIILGEKSPRKCRFCKRTKPEVKFKKDAHIIPEFMGSHNLLSYFECDECNSKFSKFEDSFSNFLGINRTISQIKGKGNKIPKYKDPRTGLEIEISDKGIQMISLEGTDVFDIDEKEKSFVLKTKRPGYIPMHIPKLFIKIGFSMLLENELENFETTRKFLLDTENESQFENSNLLRIFGYFIPGPPKYDKPFVQLFQKKNLAEYNNLPLYQIIIYYSNYQFQLTLPFGKLDEHLQGKKVELPIAPLIIDNSYLEQYGSEKFLNLNLTSCEKKSNENSDITFSFERYEEKRFDK